MEPHRDNVMAFITNEDCLALRHMILSYGVRPVLDILADEIEILMKEQVNIPYDTEEINNHISTSDVITVCSNLREPMF